MNKKSLIVTSVIFSLLVIVFSLSNLVIKFKKSEILQKELYESITDSLVTYKNKNNLNESKIKVIIAESEKDFLKIKNLEGTNLELQNLIKNKDKKIKDLNTALIIASETKITDTLRQYYLIGGDTIAFSKSILLDTINNQWYDATFGFKYGISYLDLSIKNKYNVLIGYEGKTIFKKGIPYATITNLNPHSSTVDMRVYQVKVDKARKINLGLNAGVGGMYDLANMRFGVGPYVGFGLTYNLW